MWNRRLRCYIRRSPWGCLAVKKLGFNLKAPCRDCPFRSDIRPYFRRSRVEQIARDLERNEVLPVILGLRCVVWSSSRAKLQARRGILATRLAPRQLSWPLRPTL